MTSRIFILSLILFISLTGCAIDRSLSPPPDSEQMTVTVKLPKELNARTVEAIYRSPVCKRITQGASGQRIELEGYHAINIQLQRQGQSDLHEATLPLDGGGHCQWRLSNLLFGVTYGVPSRFGENVSWGAGGGVVVMFDHNRPSLSPGLPIKINGDLEIRSSYYLWVDEDFLGVYEKTVNLAGEGGVYLMFQALQARRVYFEPVLHGDFVLYSAGPKVKKHGNYVRYTYPDGSVLADGLWHPDFRKLEAIRLAAENQK